jgi:hypothetical protein
MHKPWCCHRGTTRRSKVDLDPFGPFRWSPSDLRTICGLAAQTPFANHGPRLLPSPHRVSTPGSDDIVNCLAPECAGFRSLHPTRNNAIIPSLRYPVHTYTYKYTTSREATRRTYHHEHFYYTQEGDWRAVAGAFERGGYVEKRRFDVGRARRRTDEDEAEAQVLGHWNRCRMGAFGSP